MDKNKTGDEGAKGYSLSYYLWDKAEALHVKECLGLYLGRKLICKYFSQDHWSKVANWRYNKALNKQDTTEEIDMASNVLKSDSTASIMQAYIDRKQADHMTEITSIENSSQSDKNSNSGENEKVLQLQHKVDTCHNNVVTLR